MYDKVPESNFLDAENWGHERKVYIWLKVTDSGCGMTKEEQKKLFGRFAQATPRTHIKYGGSGLGLFICKSLSTLQRGAIGVSSERGVGSTFVFYISARLAKPPAVLAGGLGQPMMQPKSIIEDAMRKVKLNVLIVEDNLVNQKVLQKHLQMFGWNTSVAGNGQEALDWLKDSVYWRIDGDDERRDIRANGDKDQKAAAQSKHELDIILMDVEMPLMDGLACARIIREYEEKSLLAFPSRIKPTNDQQESTSPISPITPSSDAGYPFQQTQKPRLRLPILAVSANARTEQIGHALAAGMDDAISKPFRIPELWPKVCSLVKRISKDDKSGAEEEDA